MFNYMYQTVFKHALDFYFYFYFLKINMFLILKTQENYYYLKKYFIEKNSGQKIKIVI